MNFFLIIIIIIISPSRIRVVVVLLFILIRLVDIYKYFDKYILATHPGCWELRFEAKGTKGI